MGYTYARLDDGILLVVCEQEGEYRKGHVPYVLIRKKNGAENWAGKRYYRDKGSPGICLVALETVEEDDVIYLKNHRGETQIYCVKNGQLVLKTGSPEENTSGVRNSGPTARDRSPKGNTPGRSGEPRGKPGFSAPREDRTAPQPGSPGVSGGKVSQTKEHSGKIEGYIIRNHRTTPLCWASDGKAQRQ